MKFMIESLEKYNHLIIERYDINSKLKADFSMMRVS